MDIRINRTGSIKYQLNSQIASLLLEAFPEQFERVQPTPIPVADRYFVRTELDGTITLVAQLARSETFNFRGKIPSASWDGFLRYCGGKGPSEEIVAEYQQKSGVDSETAALIRADRMARELAKAKEAQQSTVRGAATQVALASR
jgi:hypothetical protein